MISVYLHQNYTNATSTLPLNLHHSYLTSNYIRVTRRNIHSTHIHLGPPQPEGDLPGNADPRGLNKPQRQGSDLGVPHFQHSLWPIPTSLGIFCLITSICWSFWQPIQYRQATFPTLLLPNVPAVCFWNRNPNLDHNTSEMFLSICTIQLLFTSFTIISSIPISWKHVW